MKNECTGAQVLRNMGLKLDEVRKSVLHVLNRDGC
jgi:hypothetical protein